MIQLSDEKVVNNIAGRTNSGTRKIRSLNQEEKARLYARVFDKTMEGILITDHKAVIISVNPMFSTITGYTEEEVIGRKPSLLKSGRHERGFYKNMWVTMHKTGSWQGEIWNRRKNGEVYPEWLTINVVRDEQNKPINYIGIFSDISERKNIEKKLTLNAQVFENASEGIMITGTDMKIVSVNPAFTSMTGYREKEVLGRTPAILHSKIQKPEFYLQMWATIHETGSWQGEIWNRRKNGEIYPEWLTINTVRDENNVITNYVGIFSDITERKQSEEHLRFLAHYDVLTGLPNRFLFHDRLNQAMLQSERNHKCVALLFVDLDRFKMINDSLGHATGDKLLKQVAQRLVSCVRQSDTVSRLGGDEFILVCPNMQSEQDAIRIAQALNKKLEQPFMIEQHEIYIGASIGISIYPFDGQDFETLIKNADLAMYKAKEKRSGYQLFNMNINNKFEWKMNLENGLRKALEKDQFKIYYQPQLGVQSGAVEGMEALLRWQHDQLGLVSPAEFIPIAEECGLIIEIGEWVIREVCKQIKLWQEQGYQVPNIAINMSARQFGNNQFIDMIQSIIEEVHLDASCLVIEITESISIDKVDSILNTLNELKRIGVQVAIDDFGKGHSALSYLKHLPIDILKIDKCFIKEITDDRRDTAITQAMIHMAHGMGLRVIAEGVETQKQMDCLKRLDCDAVQGYLISQPVPAEIALGFLN